MKTPGYIFVNFIYIILNYLIEKLIVKR